MLSTYESNKKRIHFVLEDMLKSMDRIEEYLGELDFKKFKQTYLVVDAIIRNFEIIGEASQNIPSNIQEKIYLKTEMI